MSNKAAIALLVLGVAFLVAGMLSQRALVAVGVVFLVVGLSLWWRGRRSEPQR